MGGDKLKVNNKVKVLVIAIVIAIVSIFIYKGAIAPKLYDKYLNTGIKYLTDGNYKEAILAFDKAIKIEDKSTEARVYQAQAYIGNEEYDKAVNVLEEAQQIDLTNEELLKEMLEILNKIDPDIAYDFLDRFIDAIGKDNISSDIKDIYDLAYDSPSEPISDPKPGTYVNEISVKLKQDKLKVGHSYYYTLDGSTPTKDSKKYIGKIDIKDSKTINLIGYNKNNESTDIVTLEYVIDKNIIKELKDNLSKGEKLLKDTEVGSEIGNISKDDKNKLQVIVNKVKSILKQEVLIYEDAKDMNDKIIGAIKQFEEDIIKPVDKSKLKYAISKANNLYNNSIEGSKVGQYKLGSKYILNTWISKSEDVYNHLLSKQDEIDLATSRLNSAINTFQNSKVGKKEFTSQDAIQYLINKYGEAPIGCSYIAKDYGIQNGLRYWFVLFVEDNDTHPFDSWNVYEDGRIEVLEDVSIY